MITVRSCTATIDPPTIPTMLDVIRQQECKRQVRINPVVVLRVTNQQKTHLLGEIQDLLDQIHLIGNEVEGSGDQFGNTEENHDNIILE